MGVRNFLVGLVAFILLIWGPIDHSWPVWFGIRVGYLIAIPAFTAVVLNWLWRKWQPDRTTENRLRRTLVGIVAGALFVGAIVEAQRGYHFECTQEVRTRDGRECVGDYVRVPGPDLGHTMILVVAGIFAFSFGVRSPSDDEENEQGAE